ncbi:hypothetical protein KIH27_15940 [Mycobacterium sp. M1]|uniref:Uncharacterized protein n=1 Tax=Mycolicibacter acidiphilus TaxID=2835306 RepID=A0ABS5RLN2_9MYCO|nr:hypothetical protein [Mycolicibacter acidiphilus]
MTAPIDPTRAAEHLEQPLPHVPPASPSPKTKGNKVVTYAAVAGVVLVGGLVFTHKSDDTPSAPVSPTAATRTSLLTTPPKPADADFDWSRQVIHSNPARISLATAQLEMRQCERAGATTVAARRACLWATGDWLLGMP